MSDDQENGDDFKYTERIWFILESLNSQQVNSNKYK